MTGRKVYRIQFVNGRWHVRDAGPSLSAYGKRDDAVRAGQLAAQHVAPSHLVVHHEDGSLDCEFFYDEQPAGAAM